MPRVSEFQGVVAYFYFEDHPPPHFHIRYGGGEVAVAILSGTAIDGALPRRLARIVREWTQDHRDELYANWDRVQRDLSPIPIEPHNE